MPRSHRARRRTDQVPPLDVERARSGWRRTEVKRHGTWNVQPLAAAAAAKEYVCPGCGNRIAPGIAHLVIWRADGVLGDADDLAARRHWHEHCWRIGA